MIIALDIDCFHNSTEFHENKVETAEWQSKSRRGKQKAGKKSDH